MLGQHSHLNRITADLIFFFFFTSCSYFVIDFREHYRLSIIVIILSGNTTFPPCLGTGCPGCNTIAVTTLAIAVDTEPQVNNRGGEGGGGGAKQAR